MVHCHSTLSTPTHIYLQHMVLKTVTLTVTNSNGCREGYQQNKYWFTHYPSRHFLSLPRTVWDPLSILPMNLHDSIGYLGSIVKWHWNFGDGSSTTVNFPNNPSVTHYIYRPCHIIYCKGSQDTQQLPTAVQHCVDTCGQNSAFPLASFSFPTSNCASQSVQFTDNSQANGGGNITQCIGIRRSTVRPRANIATSQNPAHTFIGAGPTLRLLKLFTMLPNCTDTVIHTVTIIARPVAKFVADSVCLGSLTTFYRPIPPEHPLRKHHWELTGRRKFRRHEPYLHVLGSSGVFFVTLTVYPKWRVYQRIPPKLLLFIQNQLPPLLQLPRHCSGDSVHFTDLSTHTASWPDQHLGLNFGDGNTTTLISAEQPECWINLYAGRRKLYWYHWQSHIWLMYQYEKLYRYKFNRPPWYFILCHNSECLIARFCLPTIATRRRSALSQWLRNFGWPDIRFCQ